MRPVVVSFVIEVDSLRLTRYLTDLAEQLLIFGIHDDDTRVFKRRRGG